MKLLHSFFQTSTDSVNIKIKYTCTCTGLSRMLGANRRVIKTLRSENLYNETEFNGKS